MALNLGILQKSIATLDRSLKVANTDLEPLGKDFQKTIRAGVIQHFEVAYEQCWKMMQRWLKANRNPEEAENPRTRKDLFRMAARQGLIVDPIPWFKYGEARNQTSHTYNEGQAASVYNIIADFLKDAKYFERQLDSRND